MADNNDPILDWDWVARHFPAKRLVFGPLLPFLLVLALILWWVL